MLNTRDLKGEDLQVFLRMIRGKSYTDVLNMFHPEEYGPDPTCYIFRGKEVVSKDKVKAVILDYMRMANK